MEGFDAVPRPVAHDMPASAGAGDAEAAAGEDGDEAKKAVPKMGRGGRPPRRIRRAL
jgi:hypothetical protein